MRAAEFLGEPGGIDAPYLKGVGGRRFVEAILIGGRYLHVPEVTLEMTFPPRERCHQAYRKGSDRI